MTVPIERNTLSVRTTEPRMTPLPAARRFTEALAQTGRALLNGAVGAVSFLPGGNALAATVRGATSSVTSSGGGGSASAEGPGPGPANPGGGSTPEGGDDILILSQEYRHGPLLNTNSKDQPITRF